MQLVFINDAIKDPLYRSVINGYLQSLGQIENISSISVEHNNLNHLAFILKNSYKYYPVDTLFLVIYKVDKKTDYLIIKHDGYRFALPDNGIITLIFSDKDFQQCYRLKIEYTSTFVELDVIHNIIQVLDNQLSKLEVCNKFNEKILPDPVFKKSRIIALIVYYDIYGNGITNLSKENFERYLQRFNILVSDAKFFISGVEFTFIEDYSEVDNGDYFVLFDSFGFLEFGIKNASLKDHIPDKEVEILIKK